MPTCSWCAMPLEEDDVVVIKIDAQGFTHHFHSSCWDRHIACFGQRVTTIVQGIHKE